MDADRFDTFVHALAVAVPASRRTALAAGLATLLTRIGSEDAAARKKRRKKKKCKGGKKKCGKTCIPKSHCCGDASCGGCETCQSGICVSGCQPGQTCQDDQCICVDGDCPDDATCEDGVCVCSEADETICGESCVNLETDGDNCGACGIVCETGQCVHGACICGTNAQCPEGCTCFSRLEGGAACRGGASSQPCDSDDDCPLGTFCLFRVNVGTETCSEPCLE